MNAPTRARISPEEFNRILALPENQDRTLELWDGEILETMPSRLHSYIQILLGSMFVNYLTANPIGYAYTEFRIDIGDESYKLVPDITVALKEQGESDWYGSLPFMPALVVEIQSPDQSDRFMREKADYYVERGCRLVITIYLKRIVEVRTKTDLKLLVPGDTIDGGDVLPGFRVEVAALFPKQDVHGGIAGE